MVVEYADNTKKSVDNHEPNSDNETNVPIEVCGTRDRRLSSLLAS